MYHYTLDFYLINIPEGMKNIIKQISPSEKFSHQFMESDNLNDVFLEKSDIIIYVSGQKDFLKEVLEKKKVTQKLFAA